VVQAEAVLWATQLLTALDWTKIANPIVGADRSVVLPSPGQVSLRGRIEVVAPIESRSRPNGRWVTPPSALFMMMFGRPTPAARIEMGLAALAVAFDDRHSEIPVRIIGWWPQSGRALVLPVDLALLERTCEAVVAAVQRKCPTKLLATANRRGRYDTSKVPVGRRAALIAAETERVAS
jgi:hypothetical protein